LTSTDLDVGSDGTRAGETPLHWAASTDDVLIGAGGDVDVPGGIEAFWQACHGGQFRAAQRLLERGPDLNYHPGYSDNPPIEIAAQVDTRRQQLVAPGPRRAANSTTTRRHRQRCPMTF